MTQAKHTPGPWRSQGWVPTWAYIPVHDASHNLVASMYPDSGHKYTREQVEANARLIAAAPDLLAALQEANRLYSTYGLVADHKDCGPWINSVRDAIAIAKAEGQS